MLEIEPGHSNEIAAPAAHALCQLGDAAALGASGVFIPRQPELHAAALQVMLDVFRPHVGGARSESVSDPLFDQRPGLVGEMRRNGLGDHAARTSSITTQTPAAPAPPAAPVTVSTETAPPPPAP